MSATMIIGNKNYSSWSLRAWLMAKKTPLDFDELSLDLDTDDFYARIEALSPSKTVPALHLDDEVIWDSLAIGETLADRYPQAGLWPEDPARRAFARSVSAEMHSGFFALRSEMPMNCRAIGRVVDASKQTHADIDRIKAIWAQCRQRARGEGGLLGGFTIVDAMYIPVALRFVTYGVALNAAEQAYVAWVQAEPDVAAWIEHARVETHVIDREEVG